MSTTSKPNWRGIIGYFVIACLAFGFCGAVLKGHAIDYIAWVLTGATVLLAAYVCYKVLAKFRLWLRR